MAPARLEAELEGQMRSIKLERYTFACGRCCFAVCCGIVQNGVTLAKTNDETLVRQCNINCQPAEFFKLDC
jgi:hypothetical protein